MPSHHHPINAGHGHRHFDFVDGGGPAGGDGYDDERSGGSSVLDPTATQTWASTSTHTRTHTRTESDNNDVLTASAASTSLAAAKPGIRTEAARVSAAAAAAVLAEKKAAKKVQKKDKSRAKKARRKAKKETKKARKAAAAATAANTAVNGERGQAEGGSEDEEEKGSESESEDEDDGPLVGDVHVVAASGLPKVGTNSHNSHMYTVFFIDLEMLSNYCTLRALHRKGTAIPPCRRKALPPPRFAATLRSSCTQCCCIVPERGYCTQIHNKIHNTHVTYDVTNVGTYLPAGGPIRID